MGAFKFSLKKDAPHQRPWERGRLCAVPALAPQPQVPKEQRGRAKHLRAAALAFPTAAAPLISPKLCGPPTGLPMGILVVAAVIELLGRIEPNGPLGACTTTGLQNKPVGQIK